MVLTEPGGMLAVIHVGIDPILFRIGGLAVHWYGIMYAVAFAVAFRYGVLPHLRSRGIPQPVIERLTAWTILWGLLGARLYYVVQQPNLKDFLLHPIRIIAVWEGGMAFFGAIIGGLTAIWFLARRNKLAFWLLADAGVLFAVMGQPIGRIGNVINGDILGARSDLPWATAYTFHTNPGQCAVLQPGFFCGVGYQPAAVYEALGTLAILGILLLLRRRGVRDGILALAYVAAYSVSQLLLFQFRKSEPPVLGGLRQAQVTAIVVLLVGVPALYWLWRRSPEAAAPPPPPRPRKVRAPKPTRAPKKPSRAAGAPKPLPTGRAARVTAPPAAERAPSAAPQGGDQRRAAPGRRAKAPAPAPPPAPAGAHPVAKKKKGRRQRSGDSGSPSPPPAPTGPVTPVRSAHAPAPPPPPRAARPADPPPPPPPPKAVKPPPPAPLPPPPPKN
ncbi:MAG: prolipoprotein diacylglyceryl transferase [Candidatus Dormibacteria bacterium]